ncbi:hypothetical protein O181_078463 [Austropuccinia psidii MF-1]|uniref:Uncharacterized protein n=1 Tax=Austropuccinia psidii MF-1 TaxID=1389203 RepID=A0A9Q3IEN8_9BASI|nr:hypothetical protein [Austropuccinia psidii MF-1]
MDTPQGRPSFPTTKWPFPVWPSPEEHQQPNNYKYDFTPNYTTGPKASPSAYTGVQGTLASQKMRELINLQNWQQNHKSYPPHHQHNKHLQALTSIKKHPPEQPPHLQRDSQNKLQNSTQTYQQSTRQA